MNFSLISLFYRFCFWDGQKREELRVFLIRIATLDKNDSKNFTKRLETSNMFYLDCLIFFIQKKYTLLS